MTRLVCPTPAPGRLAPGAIETLFDLVVLNDLDSHVVIEAAAIVTQQADALSASLGHASG